ncbi:MAG: hypothetical protein E7E64_05095 [Clostridium celatum]|uniref:hypothetical protein n=1 Tax=Clostridium tertium TaxID=1559 RepID=UPI0028FFC3B5|nr:hypothetical protein [Clostridium celatum]
MSNNMNVEVISFFDTFSDNKEIKEFDKAQEVIKAETKVESKKGKTKTSTNNKTEAVSKAKTKIDIKQKIEEECSKCEVVKVSVFGIHGFTLEDQEEIKAIKLDNILDRLINMGFDELTYINPEWRYYMSEDKKMSTICPVYPQLYAKG